MRVDVKRGQNAGKVLETVVNNLEVTNNLDIEPDMRCRVLMTSTLESFVIGHTIVLSRGLIDVLPDEASLAMIIAHELAHIALGHRLDTKYAFNDRMLFEDPEGMRLEANFVPGKGHFEQPEQLPLKTMPGYENYPA